MRHEGEISNFKEWEMEVQSMKRKEYLNNLSNLSSGADVSSSPPSSPRPLHVGLLGCITDIRRMIFVSVCGRVFADDGNKRWSHD